MKGLNIILGDLITHCETMRATLAERIDQRSIRKDHKGIKMLLYSTTKTTDFFQVKISSLNKRFKINAEVSKL